MKCIRLLAFLLLISFSVFSQERQKVGLVLSGGGARGLAHVGVLKALEEANIPIDYISGTSIGAIVGGLYASGYSIKEIESFFLSYDFQNWLQGNIDNRYTFYYKQKQEDPAFATLNFDASDKFKFQFPSSYVDLNQMDYAFMEIFSKASIASKNNFDSLFIPFLCIATDIQDNKSKVFRNGNLAQAIRASMTFPFYFSPISIDGKIMFDGGMYNNFPSEEMLKYFNPDIIIGVKVAGNYSPPKEGDILSYLQNILTGETNYSVICENGIMIEPNLNDFGILDFSRMDESLKIGYKTTLDRLDEIREIIKDTISKQELEERRLEFRNKKIDLKISQINIKGVSNSQERFIRKTLEYSLDKDSISLESIKDNYFNLYSDYNIISLQPQLKFDTQTNSKLMEIDIRTKEFLSAKIGGILSTNPISHLYLGLDYNVLKSQSFILQGNMYAGRYYTSYGLKARLDYSTSFPLYSELEYNNNKWSYYRLKTNFFDYSPLNYLVQKEKNIQLTTGMPISRRDKVAFNIGYGETNDDYFNTNFASIYDTTDNTKFKHLATGITRIFSTLDSPFYPYKGMYSKFKLQYVYGKELFKPGNTSSETDILEKKHSWLQFSFKHKQYYSISKYYSLGMNADIFYSLQDLFSNYNSSLLNSGIYNPTIETLTQFMPEYRANQYVGFGVENIFKRKLLRTDASFHLSAFIFAPMQRITTLNNNIPKYSDSYFDRYYFILSSSLIFNTPLGPLSIIAGYHQRENRDENPYTISINFGYLLFNNKNINR